MKIIKPLSLILLAEIIALFVILAVCNSFAIVPFIKFLLGDAMFIFAEAIGATLIAYPLSFILLAFLLLKQKIRLWHIASFIFASIQLVLFKLAIAIIISDIYFISESHLAPPLISSFISLILINYLVKNRNSNLQVTKESVSELT